MAGTAQSSKQLDAPDHQCKNPIELVLNNLVVVAEKRLAEGQRADGPGFMIAPYQKERPSTQESGGQKKPDPAQGGKPHGMGELSDAHQDNQKAGYVMIALRIGDAFRRTFPRLWRRATVLPVIRSVRRIDSKR